MKFPRYRKFQCETLFCEWGAIIVMALFIRAVVAPILLKDDSAFRKAPTFNNFYFCHDSDAWQRFNRQRPRVIGSDGSKSELSDRYIRCGNIKLISGNPLRYIRNSPTCNRDTSSCCLTGCLLVAIIVSTMRALERARTQLDETHRSSLILSRVVGNPIDV